MRLAREALESGRTPPMAAQIAYSAGGFAGEVPAGATSDCALSVSQFYDRLRRAVRAEFPDEVWVTGEIRKVTVSKGHRYIELADQDSETVAAPGGGWSKNHAPTLDVACWSRDWPTIAASLDAVGLELVVGLVVRLRGRVSVWDAGRVRFSLSDLDVESLVGGIAAARRKLLHLLQAEGVLEANKRLPMPPVPLRVGLVTSPGSEAYRDFTGQLTRSGFAFAQRLQPALVQGPEAPAQIAGAIARLASFDPDLIVVVRGGGAKGDLAAFDHALVARAIVSSPVPVWTGIGHTGDLSVADEVAHRCLVTPTDCGKAVVDTVLAYLSGLDERARRVELAGRRALEQAATSLGRRSDRLGAAMNRCLEASLHENARRRGILEALDPRRQLERGWSIARRRDGSVVRSIAEVAEGDELSTIVVDGRISSAVLGTRAGESGSET